MKSSFFLFTFIFTFFFISCGKKEIVPVVPMKLKMSERMFVRTLVNDPDVKKLQKGYCLTTGINEELVVSSTDFFTVWKLPDSCSYGELNQLLKKISLTCVWISPESGSHLLIENYNEFIRGYEWYERFLVLEPRPVISVEIGDTLYFVQGNGMFWGEKEITPEGLILR